MAHGKLEALQFLVWFGFWFLMYGLGQALREWRNWR